MADDEQLDDDAVMAIALREPGRFRALFERHYDAVHAYAAKRYGSDVPDDGRGVRGGVSPACEISAAGRLGASMAARHRSEPPAPHGTRAGTGRHAWARELVGEPRSSPDTFDQANRQSGRAGSTSRFPTCCSSFVPAAARSPCCAIGRSFLRADRRRARHPRRHGPLATVARTPPLVEPSEVVTLDELRDEFERQAGTRPKGAVRGPKVIRVKEDHQYRRWYVSVVFDRTTGELLEHALYMRQETTAQRPRLQHNTIRGRGAQPPWRVAMAVDRQAAYDAALYEVRERTTTTSDARSPACATTPRMCR